MRRRPDIKYLIAGLLSAIIFICYYPALWNDFVDWDDPDYVLSNPHIHSLSLSFLKWAFSSFYASNWHPLTWISHALDYAVWGLNPMGHHLTNNVLHAINTFLVVLLVVRLMETWKTRTSPHLNVRGGKEKGKGKKEGSRDIGVLITAGTTGLLFGLHPMHIESVAWVSERKDLLCALFYLLSIMAYTGYVCGGGGPPKEGHPQGVAPVQKDPGRAGLTKYGPGFFNKHYLLSLFFFILALMSKPMAVSLPAILLILDWYPFGRIRSLKTGISSFAEKLPFIGLSVASSVVTVLAQKEAMRSMEFVPLSVRLLVAAKSLVVYLWKMLIPVNLVPFYPYPHGASLFSLEYLPAVILVGACTIAAVIMAKKKKLPLAVLSYYVITLIPVIGIVQVGGQAMADRYTYLPSLGPFLMAGLGAAWVADRMSGLWRGLPVKAAAALITVIAAVPLIYLTTQQLEIWKNSLIFWQYIIKKEPGVPTAYNGLGVELDKMGQLDNAIDDYNKAIDLNPSYGEAYINRGMTLIKKGRFDNALADFNKAIALDPLSYKAYNNKGTVYGEVGSFGQAIEQFNKSIEIRPDAPSAYGNRGLAYFFIGEYGRAMEDLNKAIELDSRYSEAYGTRGNVYLKTGNREYAIADFQRACDLGDKKGCDVLRTYLP